MSSPSQPPQSNPVLTAYESFVEQTPLVTRYILNSLTLSYLLSFFVDFGKVSPSKCYILAMSFLTHLIQFAIC